MAQEKAHDPSWPSLPVEHPLSQLSEKLPALLKEAEYAEVYGIDLHDGTLFQRNMILQKFLRANANNVDQALSQLLDTLKWRKSYQPLKVKDEVFDKVKFGGLGYVTVLKDVPGSENVRDSATFNIYGAVTDDKATFGDVAAFMRWRIALMEMSVAALDLQKADKPIPDYGKGIDPYQGYQIHDYLNVSFLRQNADQKAAAKEAIATFQKYYPETLSRKFFVNVPVIMGKSGSRIGTVDKVRLWLKISLYHAISSIFGRAAKADFRTGWTFSAMKVFMSAETAKKLVVLTYGKDLAGELGKDVPEIYGGKGSELSANAQTPRCNDSG